MLGYSFYVRIELDGERRPWINAQCVYPNWRIESFHSGSTKRLSGLDEFLNKMEIGLTKKEQFFLYHQDLTLDFLNEQELQIFEDSPSEEILILPIETFKKFIYDYRAFLETYESGGIPGLPFSEDENEEVDS